jgi:hypothetical protein
MPFCERVSVIMPGNFVRQGWRLSLGALLWMLAASTLADVTYLTTDDFLHETFGAAPPKPQFLWLDDAAQARLKPIFGHAYPQARLRYWRGNGKTVWILEDIGKEFPITAGFVIKDHAIDSARVLTYREARGDEIHYPGFLGQFSGSHLRDDKLEPGIDGISGATLSVDAMRRMARAALTVDPLAP